MADCEMIKKENIEKSILIAEDIIGIEELISEELDLEKFTSECKVFSYIDSLKHEKAPEFFNKLGDSLMKNNNKLIMPLKGIRIIEDNSDGLDEEISSEWRRALNILKDLQIKDVLDIRGEETDGSLNSLIYYVFAKHRVSENLFLLTQNEDLARDILALNNSRTVKANKIQVYRINDKGSIESYEISEIND